MCEPAAGFVGGGGIDRRIADIDKRDLPLFVHHESHAVRHPVGAQYTIRLLGRAIFEIAQQREAQLKLFGEDFLGGNVIGADAKNFCVVAFKFCDTSLVRCEFLRSTTGECGRKKSQHHGSLAFEIGQRDLTAHGRAERKVRRDIAHFKRCGVAGLLGEHNRTGRERHGGGCE